MKITIVCVGKIKEKYFTGAIEEYAKRLGRYWNISAAIWVVISVGIRMIFSRRSGQKGNFYEKQLTYIDCRYTI